LWRTNKKKLVQKFRKVPVPDVKAADVAELGKVTGAGMMDCKKAIVESKLIIPEPPLV
jgi:hypothetical protein